MLKRIFPLFLAAFTALSPSASARSSDDTALPEGWLLWHSYSDYGAMDSSLYVRSPKGDVTEITGSFCHAMNGCFGSSPNDIVFMAIDKNADEWDIFRANTLTGEAVNLTERSGFRNEDPKFSPDGSKVVFKRGRWETSVGGFVYDLAELDLTDGSVTMLTDTPSEEAMPCFSADGKNIYYADYKDGLGSICRLDRASLEIECLYAEEGISAYYPVVCGGDLYFTKQYSSANRNDLIMRYDGKSFSQMPFDSPESNCSDACPLGNGAMIYSCTQNGSYDLFLYDGEISRVLAFASSEKQELGARFYSAEQLKDYAVSLHGFSMGMTDSPLNFDLNGDGCVNCFDTICVRKLLMQCDL